MAFTTPPGSLAINKWGKDMTKKIDTERAIHQLRRFTDCLSKVVCVRPSMQLVSRYFYRQIDFLRLSRHETPGPRRGSSAVSRGRKTRIESILTGGNQAISCHCPCCTGLVVESDVASAAQQFALAAVPSCSPSRYSRLVRLMCPSIQHGSGSKGQLFAAIFTTPPLLPSPKTDRGKGLLPVF